MSGLPTRLGALRSFDDLRGAIELIDDQLVILLNARAELARRLQPPGVCEHREASRALVTAFRYRNVERLRAQNPGPIGPDALVAVFREVDGACRAAADPVELTVLDVTRDAARLWFGSVASMRSERALGDVFARVGGRRDRIAVVPFSHERHGPVWATIDAITRSKLTVLAELRHSLAPHLWVHERACVSQLHTVYGTRESLSDTDVWLATHVPQATRVEADDTEDAVRRALTTPDAGAVAGAPDTSGRLVIAASDIGSRRPERRSCLVLGHGLIPPAPGVRTVISVRVVGVDRAKVRAVFDESSVAPTESYVRSNRRTGIVDAVVQFEGDDHHIQATLDALEVHAARVEILGRHPVFDVASVI